MREFVMTDDFPLTSTQFQVAADNSVKEPVVADTVTWVHSQSNSSQLNRLRQNVSRQALHPPQGTVSVLHSLATESSKSSVATASSSTSHHVCPVNEKDPNNGPVNPLSDKQSSSSPDDSNPWGGMMQAIALECHKNATAKMKTIEKKSTRRLVKSLSDKLAPHRRQLASVSRTSCEDLLEPPNQRSTPTTTTAGPSRSSDCRPSNICPKTIERSTSDSRMFAGDTKGSTRVPCKELPSASNKKPRRASTSPPQLPAPEKQKPTTVSPLQPHHPLNLIRQHSLPEKPSIVPTRAKENPTLVPPPKSIPNLPKPAPDLPPPPTPHTKEPPTLTPPTNGLPQPIRASQPNSRPAPPPLGMRRVRTYGPGGTGELPPYSQSQTLPTKQRPFKTPFARPSSSPEVPLLQQQQQQQQQQPIGHNGNSTTVVPAATKPAVPAAPARQRGSVYPAHVPYLAPARDPYSPSTETTTSVDVDMEDERGSSPAPEADSSFGELEFSIDFEALNEVMKKYD